MNKSLCRKNQGYAQQINTTEIPYFFKAKACDEAMLIITGGVA